MRLIIAAVIVTFAAGTSGCASTSGSSYATSARDKNQSLNQRDQVYMNRVERIAASRGVEVEWVNPPYANRQRSNVRNFSPKDDG
jgi:hypothetical protein